MPTADEPLPQPDPDPTRDPLPPNPQTEAEEAATILDLLKSSTKRARQDPAHPANVIIKPDSNSRLTTQDGEWKYKNPEKPEEGIERADSLVTAEHFHYLHPNFETVPVPEDERETLRIDDRKSDKELMAMGIPVASIGHCAKCGFPHDKYRSCDARGLLRQAFPSVRLDFWPSPSRESFRVTVDAAPREPNDHTPPPLEFFVAGEWDIAASGQEHTLRTMKRSVEQHLAKRSAVR